MEKNPFALKTPLFRFAGNEFFIPIRSFLYQRRPKEAENSMGDKQGLGLAIGQKCIHNGEVSKLFLD